MLKDLILNSRFLHKANMGSVKMDALIAILMNCWNNWENEQDRLLKECEGENLECCQQYGERSLIWYYTQRLGE